MRAITVQFVDPVDNLDTTPAAVTVPVRMFSFEHEVWELLFDFPVWVSPAGNYCFYWNWMDERGACHSSIVAFRRTAVYW